MGRNIFATFAITLPMAIAFVSPSARMPVHLCARRGRSARPVARVMAMSADAIGATSGGAVSHTPSAELQTARTAVSTLRSQLEGMESELSRTRAELRVKEARAVVGRPAECPDSHMRITPLPPPPLRVTPPLSVAAGATQALLARLDGSSSTAVYRETSQRSLVKALGWRVTAGMVTMFSSLLFTGGNLKIALAIVSSDFISKSGTMFIGERLFNKVKLGKKEGGQKDTMARSIGKVRRQRRRSDQSIDLSIGEDSGWSAGRMPRRFAARRLAPPRQDTRPFSIVAPLSGYRRARAASSRERARGMWVWRETEGSFDRHQPLESSPSVRLVRALFAT